MKFISKSKSFDVFLSHNNSDKPLVKEIGRWLESQGLCVWLDEWNLVPGDPWQEGIEKALNASSCCAIFLGADGLGPWHAEEMRVALAARVKPGGLRVVPVLLHGATRPEKESEVPAFLRSLTWCRFGKDWQDEAALHRLLCGIRGMPLRRQTAVEVEACPYRGLDHFGTGEEDRRFFFGRESVIERLLDYLVNHRFLVVSGPSGNGKSSVVQAGLVPGLDDGKTQIQILTPQSRPLEELAFALRRAYPQGQAPTSKSLLDRLASSSGELHLISRELAEASASNRVVLVVDQFEELFTQTSSEKDRRSFIDSLLSAVERPGPTSVILVVRSDFLGRCTAHSNLKVFINDHLELIGPMNRVELESAITEPARLVGLTFEEGLVEAILDDVSGSPGELPLLQHALLELYKESTGTRRLTIAAYWKIGRVQGALSRRAEQEFGNLDPMQQEILRKMFVLCLVKPGEGTEDTRRRATRQELKAVGDDPAQAESLLSQWVDARLLTSRSDEDRSSELVDVAHEALIRGWPRLADWMADGRKEARQIDALRHSAKEWRVQGHSPHYLLEGARLAQAKELLVSHAGDLADLETNFVAASSSKALRRTRLIAATVCLVLAAVGYLAYDSNQSKLNAERQLARNYRDNARAAANRGDLSRYLHYSAEAIAISQDPQLGRNLLVAVQAFRPNFALRQILQHDLAVLRVAWSSDGRRLLTWSADGTARLWDASSGQPIGPPLQHEDSIRGAKWNGDESLVLTWSADGTARLWDASSGQPIGPPLQHEDSVRGANWNGDESLVLTWSGDGTARLWDPSSGQPIGPPLQHDSDVVGATWNGDESLVLTWSADGTARLWDASADLDLPGELALIQLRAATGTEFDFLTREVKSLEPTRWREYKSEWHRKGRNHYKVCKHPHHNLWRRFHPQEAEAIRPLD